MARTPSRPAFTPAEEHGLTTALITALTRAHYGAHDVEEHGLRPIVWCAAGERRSERAQPGCSVDSLGRPRPACTCSPRRAPPPSPQVSAQPGYSVDSLGRTEPAAAALCDVNVSYGYDDPAECNAPPAADKVCSGLQAMKLVHYPEYGRSQWECLAK